MFSHSFFAADFFVDDYFVDAAGAAAGATNYLPLRGYS